jgi:hypothetical protein
MTRDDLHDEPGAAHTAEVLRALPAAPIDAAFSGRVLRAARAELRDRNTGGAWHRAVRFCGRVAVPAALVACAAGYVYHYIQVAERVYVSHGG